MRLAREGEVEVFGKPIGFEIAFLEAGAALEDLAVGQRFMGEDTGKRPAQGIVFSTTCGLRRS